MVIEFFCPSGSPLGLIPEDIYGKGVGGAELALISLAEVLDQLGHTVRVFNNPAQPTNSHAEFLPLKAAESSKCDVFVLFRNPHPLVETKSGCQKVFWSCDQVTSGNFRTQIFPFVDQVVTISEVHRIWFESFWKCDPAKLVVSDLGVRLEDYEIRKAVVVRNPHKLIFTSVPDRGLRELLPLWKTLKCEFTDLSLVITGDYTLWGAKNPYTHEFKMEWMHEPDVEYLGKVSRGTLVHHQLSAGLHLYPCVYPELFCISVAESQVAGAFPVTTDMGALATTNQSGIVIKGDPRTAGIQNKLIQAASSILGGHIEQVEAERTTMMEDAVTRFNWKTIARDWIARFEALEGAS